MGPYEIHLINEKACMVDTRDRLSRRHRTRLIVFERDGEIYFASSAMHARSELAGRVCKRAATFRWKLLPEVKRQGCSEAETIISQFAVRTLTIEHTFTRDERNIQRVADHVSIWEIFRLQISTDFLDSWEQSRKRHKKATSKTSNILEKSFYSFSHI